MIREILSTKGASMPINSSCLKEQCTPMAASMPFCAQYQIGLSAEPRSVGLSAQPGSNHQQPGIPYHVMKSSPIRQVGE